MPHISHKVHFVGLYNEICMLSVKSLINDLKYTIHTYCALLCTYVLSIQKSKYSKQELLLTLKHVLNF